MGKGSCTCNMMSTSLALPGEPGATAFLLGAHEVPGSGTNDYTGAVKKCNGRTAPIPFLINPLDPLAILAIVRPPCRNPPFRGRRQACGRAPLTPPSPPAV